MVALISEKDGTNQKSMHERALDMLARETHGLKVNQTGVVMDGPPHQLGPVYEKKVLIDPNNIQRGYKDISLEKLSWRGPGDQKFIMVHYHWRGGKIFGEPTQEHDMKMQRQGMLYFTNGDWAQRGKYLIFNKGQKPETHFDDRIIP
jgi:hypothetical protein